VRWKYHALQELLINTTDLIAVDIKGRRRIWRTSDTIAIDCLHGDGVDQIDGGIDGMAMWWKAHVSVNHGPVAIPYSVRPTNPKHLVSNPDFNTDPNTHTGPI